MMSFADHCSRALERAQIEADDSNPRIIVTVRGAGYRFESDGLSEAK